jgi:molybdate transport system substrate-binding protein
VIVPAASGASVAGPRDLAAFKTIAVADPQVVPAGVYARTWLESLGLWAEMAPRVVPTLHVRGRARGRRVENAEAGIVYRTDAAASKRARIAFEVPRGRVRRSAIPSRGSCAHARGGERLRRLSALRRRAAVFARYGFLVLGGE